MQNFDFLKPESLSLYLSAQAESFSSTESGVKQRYMIDFLEELKQSDIKKERTPKEVLFEEIKVLLADF